MPRFILDESTKTLTIKIDNDIVENSDVYGWYFGGITPEEIDSGLDQYRGKFSTAIPMINSNGGSVTAGMAIRNSFIRLAQEGVSVEPVITGVAASIASAIALCGKKPKCYDGSYLMIHNPYTGIVGDSRELRNTADTLDKMRDDLVSIYVKSSILDVATASDKMNNETWFNFAEMISLGFGEPAPVAEGVKNSITNYYRSPFSAKLKSIPESVQNRMIDRITPAVPENKEGGSVSKLQDFLNANPDAKAEFDEAVVSVVVPEVAEVVAPVEVPTDAVKVDAKARAKAIMNSTVYGAGIKALAVDVLAGDAEVSALNAAVAAVDSVMEAKASAEAQALTAKIGETGRGSDEPVKVGNKLDSNDAALSYINSFKKKA